MLLLAENDDRVLLKLNPTEDEAGVFSSKGLLPLLVENENEDAALVVPNKLAVLLVVAEVTKVATSGLD